MQTVVSIWPRFETSGRYYNELATKGYHYQFVFARNAAHEGQLIVVVRTIPVAGPLPDVASHVIEAVRIRRIVGNG